MLTTKSKEDLRQFLKDDICGLINPDTFEKSKAWIELMNHSGAIQFCKEPEKKIPKYDRLFGF